VRLTASPEKQLLHDIDLGNITKTIEINGNQITRHASELQLLKPLIGEELLTANLATVAAIFFRCITHQIQTNTTKSFIFRFDRTYGIGINANNFPSFHKMPPKYLTGHPDMIMQHTRLLVAAPGLEPRFIHTDVGNCTAAI
jgi:hypothetical protein